MHNVKSLVKKKSSIG